MKLRFVVLLFSLVPISANAQHIDKFLNVSGKIKSIRYTHFDMDSGGIVHENSYGRFTDNVWITYNKKNRKAEEIYYDAPGKVYFRYTYEYNRKGKITRQPTYFHDETTSDNSDLYTYNKNNQLVVDTFLYDGRCKERNTYEYDSNGNLKEKRHFYWGNLNLITTYRYNDKNQLIEKYEQHLDPYSDSLKVNFTRKNKYTQDPKGNTIGEEAYKKDKLFTFTTNKYNDSNLLLESKIFNPDSTLKITYTWEYDMFGNMISEFHLDDENSPMATKMVYEYDSHNNWTRCTTYFNGNTTEMQTREITYR